MILKALLVFAAMVALLTIGFMAAIILVNRVTRNGIGRKLW